MKLINQKEVWNNIAEEWHRFKKTPSKIATEFVNNFEGRILDFGSGSGRNLLNLKENKKRELYLVDFSEKMLNLAKKRSKELGIEIKIKKSRLEKTNFKDNFFDAAICTAAIHCIETENKRKLAVKELYRILKSGAKAEIEVWDRNSKWFKNKPKEKYISWRDKGKRYYYLYEGNEIGNLFKEIGFKIVKFIPDKFNIIFIVQKP